MILWHPEVSFKLRTIFQFCNAAYWWDSYNIAFLIKNKQTNNKNHEKETVQQSWQMTQFHHSENLFLQK